jgi:glycosyltransferase involved in cell wall biosynthesis
LIQKKISFSFREIQKLKKEILLQNPDIIELKGANFDVLPSLIASKLAGEKTIMSIHGFYSDMYEIPFYKKIIYRFFTEPLSLLLVDGVYTVCEYASKRRKVRLFSRKLFGFVYNIAPDYSNFNKLKERTDVRKELEIDLNDDVAVYVGRLTYDKGASFLTRALIKLNKCWPKNFKFVVVGNGRYKEQMETELLNLKEDNKVIFTGIRDDVHRYYFASDFLVSPSLHENHSITLLEGCSAGMPILATDVGGNPEIVENYINGLLIPSMSVNEIINGIMKMLRMKNFWEEWGKNAKEIAGSKFCAEKSLKNLSDIYNSVLGK